MIQLYIRYECPFCQKVMAKAKNSIAVAGADSVEIEVGGIIPGKNGN